MNQTSSPLPPGVDDPKRDLPSLPALDPAPSADLFSHRKSSLRDRMALGVALPLLILLLLLQIYHTWSERQLLEQEATQTAYQLQKLVQSSLRVSMIGDKKALIAGTLEEALKIGTIERIQILNSEGEIWRAQPDLQAQDPALTNGYTIDSTECAYCHIGVSPKNPESFTLSMSTGTLRMISTFPNQPECQECHTAQTAHLGILLVDLALPGIQKALSTHLVTNLGYSLVSTVLITLVVYFLINRFVVRRVEAIQPSLGRLMAGDYSTRLPEQIPPEDEIGQLASLINRMAIHLERTERDRSARSQVREIAISQERERLAREIHDNTSQLLGYVINKAKAVQLLLDHNRIEVAKTQLTQLEKAAQVLNTDTREIIAGLNVSYDPDQSLAAAFAEYVARFKELTPLDVQLDIPYEVQQTRVEPETELQVLRIVQESLTNARKHAQASQVKIAMEQGEDSLFVVVEDDGIGFEPDQLPPDRYGIRSMRARAREIGIELTLESQPGFGTLMQIKIPLNRKQAA